MPHHRCLPLCLLFAGISLLLSWSLPLPAAQPAPPAGGSPFANSYPKRATDPAAAARGKSIFVANGCSFCHGADARGGNGGPSLLRSQKVLQDQKGELIGQSITKGVPGTTMAAFPLKGEEIADVAEFLHSFDVGGYDSTRLKPAVFTMGNARAGAKYFGSHCASCHSPGGDLKGVSARFAMPRDLQQHWLMPRTTTKTRVDVTERNGSVTSGTLVRVDEFLVSLTDASGQQRTFEREGDSPKVRLFDPLDAHRAMLRSIRDDDIHDVTAYLVTLK